MGQGINQLASQITFSDKAKKYQFEIINSKCHLNDTQFLCKIFRLNVNKNAKAIQCDLCKYWVYIECNHLDYIDYYKYFQGSYDPWFCATCCSAIVPCAPLNNKSFLSAISCDRFNKNNEKQVETKDRDLITFKPITKFSTSF